MRGLPLGCALFLVLPLFCSGQTRELATRQEPFICQTEAAGLGPPQDKDCFAPTIVQYYYKSTAAVGGSAGLSELPGEPAPGFKLYDPSVSDSDIASVTLPGGRTVPYLVRRELGVINRAIYEIQFLHRPNDPLPTPGEPQRGAWNGRLVYEFKGGCGAGYRQGQLVDALGPLQEPLLSQGYALATSTLNSFANNCNARLSAETLSMVKEHFIKQFGVPVHTIGWGGSGGAMQQQLIAQNHPGLLDGLIALASFPDLMTWLQTTTDCQLLDRAFNSAQNFTAAQKTAVSGFSTWHICDLPSKYQLRYLAADHCDPALPKELIYDRLRNPRGARCDLYDNAVEVFGRDPKTGFARRPLDNVGVQYGLVALMEDRIDAEQFVTLNEVVGGFDGEGAIVPERTEADPEAIETAYRRGAILTGGGGLARIPIIDLRPYTDDLGAADGHVRFHSFETRARLNAANGRAGNQVIFVDTRESWFGWRGSFWPPSGSVVPQMDRWLDAIDQDRAAGTPADKIALSRPQDLKDGCRATDGEVITERASYRSRTRCNQLYPAYGDPRIAAGGPLTNDILKCTLRPVDPADYGGRLSSAQVMRLRKVFPLGVCDYSRPGIGQRLPTESDHFDFDACVDAGRDTRVRLDTELGPVEVFLYGARAPISTCNFLRYVVAHRYDGARFFRSVRSDEPGAMVPISVLQADIAESSSQRFSPIPLERTSESGLRHLATTISMARGTPDSATSSFFISLDTQPALDFGGARNADGQGFAAFGRVVCGMNVVREIWRRPAPEERLTSPVLIRKAYVERTPTSADCKQ